MDKVRRLNSIVGLANHTVLISKNGPEVAIDDSGAPVFGADGTLAGVVLVFRNVTEQRAAQRATSRLAAIVEFSGDAILTKSLDGILKTWNTGAERLFGYKATEIIGQPVTILIPPDGLDEEAEILRRIRQGRPSERLETIRVAKDGRRVPVSVGVSPVNDAEGRIIGASNVIHDMTELVAAREARKQLEAALQSNERLALAGRLSASIAHEINNPIDAVSNALYLINQRIGGQPDVEKLISLAQTEALRVAEITRNMLKRN